MNKRIEKLGELATKSVSMVGRSLSSVQSAASNAGVVAFSAGKSAKDAIGEIIDHDDTKALASDARGICASSC